MVNYWKSLAKSISCTSGKVTSMKPQAPVHWSKFRTKMREFKYSALAPRCAASCRAPENRRKRRCPHDVSLNGHPQWSDGRPSLTPGAFLGGHHISYIGALSPVSYQHWGSPGLSIEDSLSVPMVPKWSFQTDVEKMIPSSSRMDRAKTNWSNHEPTDSCAKFRKHTGATRKSWSWLTLNRSRRQAAVFVSPSWPLMSEALQTSSIVLELHVGLGATLGTAVSLTSEPNLKVLASTASV